MPAPIALYYITLVTYLWLRLCVYADDNPPLAARANVSSDTADARSPFGRVPPYQPPGSGPVGGSIALPPIYRPHNAYTRVEGWPPRVIGDKESYVVADQLDDHDDEHGCNQPCYANQFSCQISCTCIPMDKRCDDVTDCAEAEDEAGCLRECDQSKNRTFCHGTNVCISTKWICDGDNDCGDFSDETNCGGQVNCSTDEFTCANGLCIHSQWVCDGDNDCRDNSDETNCTSGRCAKNQFTCGMGECIAQHWRCDKEPDCQDNSDEIDCPLDLILCGDHEFQCENKKCIEKAYECDGDNDCGDWSDEDTCPMLPGSCNAGEFKCNDGKCIPERWRCDSEHDCADGGDELNCGTRDFRNCTEEEYTCADKRCILKTWTCDGVRDCTNGEDEQSCEISCEADQYLCKAPANPEDLKTSAIRYCVNRKHVCDGQADCPDGDDEEKCPKIRPCYSADKCKHQCITTWDSRPGCTCPFGYLVAEDGFSCVDIDECMYEQDPVCSQTCSNTVGSYACGCMTGYVLRPDKKSCKPLGEPPTLLFSNRVGIRQVWLTGDNYMSVVKGLHNAIALDYHYEKKLVFWSENNLRVIRVAQTNNNNMTDVIKWGLETPSGLAVDWIHDLLFWTDSGTRRVEVATLDGRLRTVLAANDLDKPRAIAVHPGDALVFWTDWGPHPKIERSDMDGNRRKGIIISDIFWPNGLTIDYVESFIYWADAKHHVIERAGFDGEKRKRVTTKGLPHPFALTLFEEAIYWTDWHTKSISSLNKNTGKGIQTVHSGLNVPMDIRSFHSSRQLTSYKNRCGKNNGGCSHLCLPNRNGYTCRCPVGYSLSNNRHTCEDTPEQLLVYARSKDLRLKQLDARNQIDSIDMVIPVQNIKSAMALDWDFKTKTIFWTDVGTDTINRAYLNGSHQTAIVRTNLMSPAGIAYDWVNNKIYWTDAGTNRIEVANTDGSMRSLLAWTDIDKPRDIVVSPIDGVMYWTDWGANPCIEKADMNGDNRKRLISGNMTWPNGLALDFVSHRIYWTDGGNKTIEYADFYGYNRTILIHLGTHPFGLDVFGEEIFWTDWESQSLQAASKWTGKNRRTLGAGSPGLMDVRVFHKYRFPGYPPSCAKNNGGCSHLCLLKPHGNTACACPIGIKLGKDGKTCINGPVNYLVFAHRVDIRVVSLDVPYMIDVVLPVPPLKHALGVDVDLKTGYIYWSDTGERKIQRADIHGKGFETVIEKALTTVDGIAIDSAGRKIYWTDGGRNSIEVGDLNGENRKVLVWTTLDSPRAIALHYEQGYMFWSDWGAKAKIERADMDGRYRRVIVDNNIKWPNGLAIDKADGRLYWNDAKILTIESSDFNGNHRRTILSGVPYPYGIVIVGPHIYWTDWKTKSLHKANKTNGSDQVVLRDNLDGPMDIRAVHGAPVSPNACGDNNGGCSHLCLRNPHGYTCACPTGLNFKNLTETNPKECQDHPENFLFFASRGGLVTISLDSPELWDVHLPKNICQNPIAVDFHWGERLLFFTDVNYDVIRSINMNNMSETKDVINTNLETPNGLAVDWIANNIYWTDNDNKVIEVARLDGTSRKVLLRNLSDPRAIALFPAKGYIFWGGWDKTATIERAYLDGSHRQVIVENDCDFSTGITIDFARRRLYWIDSIKHLVETSDLEGRNRVVLFKLTDGYNPFGMTEYQDSIYWTDWQKRAILTPGKIIRKVPEITVVRADLEMPMEIKTVSPTKQRGWNPCMEDNGGCSHLCLFRLKDYICACPDVQDGRPCAEAAARPVGKMPPNYPFTDYLDEESDETATSTTKPEAISDLSGVYISIGMTVTLCLISIIVIVVILRMNRRRRGEMKENYREASGHISFHNPNYAGAAPGEPGERRSHRLQIFKYDKSQERVTNMYIPEGTSLLPAPPQPPQPPPHRAPPRPATHDDFEPVTLHPFV